jgi:hypothetical protein
MRICRCLIPLLLLASLVSGQEPSKSKRFEIDQDLDRYPQNTPQLAMKSIAKALLERKLDYLLAHLAEPTFVDARVKDHAKHYKGPAKAVEIVAFHDLVNEFADHLRRDPTIVEELYRYAKEGKWEIKENTASASLPDVASRRANFIAIKKQWYLLNAR